MEGVERGFSFYLLDILGRGDESVGKKLVPV